MKKTKDWQYEMILLINLDEILGKSMHFGHFTDSLIPLNKNCVRT